MTGQQRRPHDLGGLDGGPIDKAGHDFTYWEKQVDSIMRLAAAESRRVLTVDELRRAVEDLGPGVYDRLSYYERWIEALANLFVQKGVFSVDDLGRKMLEIESRWTADRGIPKGPSK